MNDKIREFAEQCVGNTFDYEKFAELIVRECGEVAYKTYWNNPLEVRGVHFKEAMYKRFGIGYE
jgi:hypothetical protein